MLWDLTLECCGKHSGHCIIQKGTRDCTVQSAGCCVSQSVSIDNSTSIGTKGRCRGGEMALVARLSNLQHSPSDVRGRQINLLCNESVPLGLTIPSTHSPAICPLGYLPVLRRVLGSWAAFGTLAQLPFHCCRRRHVSGTLQHASDESEKINYSKLEVVWETIIVKWSNCRVHFNACVILFGRGDIATFPGYRSSLYFDKFITLQSCRG